MASRTEWMFCITSGDGWWMCKLDRAKPNWDTWVCKEDRTDASRDSQCSNLESKVPTGRDVIQVTDGTGLTRLVLMLLVLNIQDNGRAKNCPKGKYQGIAGWRMKNKCWQGLCCADVTYLYVRLTYERGRRLRWKNWVHTKDGENGTLAPLAVWSVVTNYYNC